MRESIHDSLLKIRAHAALLEKVKAAARARHQTPSEFVREVLRREVSEAA